MYVYKTLLNDVTIAAGMELDLPRCCDATLRETLEKVSTSKQRERDRRERKDQASTVSKSNATLCGLSWQYEGLIISDWNQIE
jgi:hypothetical protein